jgi:hypothetical protein
MLAKNTNAQTLCEDFSGSSPLTWFTIGGQLPFPNPNCGVPGSGNFGTINFASNQLQFNNFRTRQTQAICSNVGSFIVNQNQFRVEFEYTFQNTGTSSPLLLMALTEQSIPSRFYSNPTAWGGAPMENNNSSIEIRIGNTLNTTNNFRIWGRSKLGNVVIATSNNINIPNGTQYNNTFYLRLERLDPSTALLSVFDDPARTNLVGSECFALDPGINNLSFVQHGGVAGAGCSNITTSQLDNLCIFRNVVTPPCQTCNPPLTVSTSSSFNCTSGQGTANAAANGGTSPYAYLWSNGGGTASITGLSAGSYTVTVTDNLGCSVVSTVSVSAPTLTASFSVTPTCPTQCLGTLTISSPGGGTPPYQYSVNSGPWSTATVYSNLCGGLNTAEIRDANNCKTLYSGNIPVVVDEWPKHPVSNGGEYAKGNGIDVTRDHYLTGQYFERITFPNSFTPVNAITLNSASNNDEDGYLVKYDECGAVWAFDFGSTADRDEGVVVRYATDDIGDAIIMGGNIHGPIPGGVTDAVGNVITTTTNGINLSTDPIPGISKALIFSVNPSTGAINWIYMVGDNVNHPTEVNDIRTYGSNVFAIGNVAGSSFAIGTDFHSQNGGWDIFLMMVDKNTGVYTTGNSTTWGSNLDDNGEAIDMAELNTPTAYLYATGYVSYNQVNIQGVTYPASTTANGRDMFVAQFTQVGLSLVQSEVHRSVGDDEGLDIASPGKSSGSSAFIITGYFENTLNLLSPIVPTVSHFGIGSGNKDIYVAAFDAIFDHVWSEVSVGSLDDIGEAITYNPITASVFVSGEFSQGASGFLGGAATSNPMDIEIFISEFDFSSGALGMLTTQQGDGDLDRAYDIEFTTNELYTTGQFGNTGMLQFPTASNAPLAAMSAVHDAYFARLDYGGNFFRKKEAGLGSSSKEDSKLEVYPNPFNAELKIRSRHETPSNIEILDVTGKVVFRRNNIQSGLYETSINMKDLPAGIYMIKSFTNDKVEIKKTVKQ